ncbi:MAG: hypothetical protein ACOC9Y_03840 [Chloroflexota bacterium]
MNSGRFEMELARSRVEEVAHRLIDDPAFREQIRESPRGTLREIGLPEEAITDFLREFHVPQVDGPEVTGFQDQCGWTCMFTCDWTFIEDE